MMLLLQEPARGLRIDPPHAHPHQASEDAASVGTVSSTDDNDAALLDRDINRFNSQDENERIRVLATLIRGPSNHGDLDVGQVR